MEGIGYPRFHRSASVSVSFMTVVAHLSALDFSNRAVEALYEAFARTANYTFGYEWNDRVKLSASVELVAYGQRWTPIYLAVLRDSTHSNLIGQFNETLASIDANNTWIIACIVLIKFSYSLHVFDLSPL